MATTLLKFSLSPTRVLLASAAVFIMLSVSSVESRQCFWCGPLAEQVHRSRRAPPCAPGVRHVTACEPGYSYCAVVATSPPYVESRYCVKMYQDECYPLYCNSTNTWKMTCPCRGDLCNGGNSEREKEAFAVLPRLVAKTNARIQKRNAAVPPTMKKHKNVKIIDPHSEEVLNNSFQHDVVKTSIDNVHAASNISGTVNQTSDIEEPGAETNKTIIETVNNSATSSLRPATAIDKVSSLEDVQTSTDMIEIDLKKWYESADKNSDEVDDDGVTLHPSRKQDKINHEITKHNDSANIHEANHKKERPIVHVDPDTKEPKSNLTQATVTTEITPTNITVETASPASSGENISLNGGNNVLQPSIPSSIEVFQQDESRVEMVAETPVVKVSESPVEKVTTSPVEKVAEEPENKINATKEPTEQSTVKPTSTTPSTTDVPKNTTVPGKSSPKQTNKNYASTISANVIIIVHCVFVNSFV